MLAPSKTGRPTRDGGCVLAPWTWEKRPELSEVEIIEDLVPGASPRIPELLTRVVHHVHGLFFGMS